MQGTIAVLHVIVTCTLPAKRNSADRLSVCILQILYLKFCTCSLQLSRISGFPRQQCLIYVSYVVSVMQKEKNLIQGAHSHIVHSFQVLDMYPFQVLD